MDYENALKLSGLDTLKERRVKLCQNFAKTCIKSGKHDDMFPLNNHYSKTRNHEKYQVMGANTGRLANSAFPYMQRLLNQF